MADKKGYKITQISMPPRLKAELLVAAELDDGRSMNQFMIDAIRERVNKVLDYYKGYIPVGHPLYRPEGASGRPERHAAIERALEKINQGPEVPTPPDYYHPEIPNPEARPHPHPLGRHLPGGHRPAHEPGR